MNGENQLLVTDEPVEFEEYLVMFETTGKLPIVIEEFIEYTPI